MHFDDAKADAAVDFIGRLTHTKGKWAGRRFEWIPWELDAVRKIYGSVRADGLRQYRFIYIEIPKKNGKGDLAAGLVTKQLIADGEKAPEVYGAAGDIEQAGLVFDSVATMVRNNKSLSKRLKIIDSRKRIIDHSTNGFYKVLSARAETKHGPSPSAIVFDEMHAQKSHDLYNYLTDGTDYGREQQLVVILTTAGEYDPTSIGWQVHEYALNVKEGKIEDDEFLPIIYSAPQDIAKSKDRSWSDMDVIRAANPAMGYIFDERKVKADLKRVSNDPVKLNNFLRFRLNVWVNNVSSYLDMQKWDACKIKANLKKLGDYTCFGAVDLSSSEDMTAFVLLLKPEDKRKKWVVIPYFYMPKDSIAEREKEDRVPYRMWAESGHLTLTDGTKVDYGAMRKDIVQAQMRYHIKWLAYDPWNATHLINELADDHGINVVEFRQGYKSISEPTKELRGLVNAGKLAHGNSPVLNWNAGNLKVKSDENENVKPVKLAKGKRIDGAVALIMCIGLATMRKEPETNIITINKYAGPMIG